MGSDGRPSAFLVRIPVSERTGVYACHRKVYEVCGRESRPLWRRVPGYVLALSRHQPDGLEARPYSPAPKIGQETRFDLVAEIAVAKKKPGQSRGRRGDPVLEARLTRPSRSYAEVAQEIGPAWLARQGSRHGFSVISLDRCEYEVIEFVREKVDVRVGAIRYSGRLRVTNAQDFAAAMLRGIGHGKAWGCGMLLCFGA